MTNIETIDNLNRQQVTKLLKWFDKTIGTDREVNQSASGDYDEFYIVFFKLEMDEPKLVAKHLDKLGFAHYYI